MTRTESFIRRTAAGPDMRLFLLALAVLLVPSVQAASIDATSPVPTGGTYTLTVVVEDFTLVEPTTNNDRTKNQGHIVYYLNGNLAPGRSATTATSYTYTGLSEGDWVSAELVFSDGTRLFPREYTALLVKDDRQVPGVPATFLAVALVGLAAAARAKD